MSTAPTLILIAPQLEPVQLAVSDLDSAITALVGSPTDIRRLTRDLVIYCHDEGLRCGLPPNFILSPGCALASGLFAGSIVVTRVVDGVDVSTTSEDLDTVRRIVAESQRPGRFAYEFVGPRVFDGDSRTEVAPKMHAAGPLPTAQITSVDGRSYVGQTCPECGGGVAGSRR